MKQKAIKAFGIALISILLFSAPIFAAGSVVAVPVKAIADIFNGMSEFVFGNGKTSADDLINLIQLNLKDESNKKLISETYSGKLVHNGVEVPQHWLSVVQLLSGIEYSEMSDVFIKSLLDSALVSVYNEELEETHYELGTVEVFSSNLMESHPFNNKLKKIPSSKLAEIINRVGNVDAGSSLSPELIEKYKGILMYPFKKYYDVGDSIGLYYPDGKPQIHNGLDLRASCGTQTYAMDDGIVTMVGTFDHMRGNYVFWKNGTREYRYLHFRDPLTLKIGDPISKGQYIGSVGNTGYSFGCHLHLEIRIDSKVINPLDLLDVYNPLFE